MNTGEEIKPIPFTTRQLLAAFIYYSGEVIFREAELVNRVEALRMLYPGNHEFSKESVLKHLRTFVTEQVLRYAGSSIVFYYDRRNDSYLQLILAASHTLPDLECWLSEIVSKTARKATMIETRQMEEQT